MRTRRLAEELGASAVELGEVGKEEETHLQELLLCTLRLAPRLRSTRGLRAAGGGDCCRLGSRLGSRLEARCSCSSARGGGVDAGEDLLPFFALPLPLASCAAGGVNFQIATAPASETANRFDAPSSSSVPSRMLSWMGAASSVSVMMGSADSPAVCQTRMKRSPAAEMRYLWSCEYVMQTTAAAWPRSLRVATRVDTSQILMAVDAVTISSSSLCTRSRLAACLPTDMRQFWAPVLTFQHATWQSAVHV